MRTNQTASVHSYSSTRTLHDLRRVLPELHMTFVEYKRHEVSSSGGVPAVEDHTRLIDRNDGDAQTERAVSFVPC